MMETENIEVLLQKLEKLEREKSALLDDVTDLSIEGDQKDMIIQQQKRLLYLRHPMRYTVETLNTVGKNYNKPLIFLDHELTVIEMTKSARRILEYKDEDPPMMDQPYISIIEARDKKIEFQRKVTQREKFKQDILLTTNKGRRVRIESNVTNYLKTSRNELIGVIVQWHKKQWPYS